MPIGAFLIDIDSKSKSTVRVEYFENNDSRIKVDNNLILQLKMGLSEKLIFTFLKPDFSIVCMMTEYRKVKEMCNFIIGVVLKSSDDPNNFRDSIKMANEIFLKEIESSNDVLLEKMKEIYHEYFETPSIVLNQKELETRLKERVKSLTKEGKFDEAKDMLEIIKKIPKKLFDANKNGEKAIKIGNFDKAEREFKKAAKFAHDLNEKDLEKTLKEKAGIVKQIPKLEAKRDKIIGKARDALRKDKLEVAYKFFMEASEVSKKLLDPRGTEEYTLKADALAKFNEIHKRFHK